MKKSKFWVILGVLWAMAVGGYGQTGARYVQPQLVTEEQRAQPGRTTWVAIQFEIEKGWHLYWMNPGDSGAPISIHWTLPDELTAGTEIYPTPEWISSNGGLVSYAYEDQLVLLVPIDVPEGVEPGEYTLAADLEWFVCSDEVCIPERGSVSTSLVVGMPSQVSDSAKSLFEQTRQLSPPTKADPEIRLEVKGNKPHLQFPAAWLTNAKPVPHHTPPDSPVYFFPEEQVIAPQSIQAPVIRGDQAILEMSWEVGGQQTTRLTGLLLVGVPSGGNPYTLYRVEAEREGEQVAAGATQDRPATPAQPEETPVWDESRFSELPGLGTTRGYVELDGKSSEITGMGMALGLAFIGGLILNIMPCVFPVLGLKVMGFVKQAGGDPARIRKHGLVFTAGVVFSFWILTGVLLVLRETLDSSLGWGFQMQEPFFMALIVLLFFFFGLSLIGVFEFGSSLMSIGGKAQSKDGYSGSFFSGIFATLVATPCVGPFLGPVLGFTLTLETYQTLLVFTAMALGLASPYLVTSFAPRLLAFFPKPGAWMETFKQILAFPMFAAAIYFLWSFGKQTGNPDNLILFTVALLLVGLAAWIWGKWATPVRRKGVRRTGLGFALLFIAISIGVAYQASQRDEQFLELLSQAAQQNNEEEGWVPFSPERMLSAWEEGRPVYVDFTATWCLVCKANKLTAFQGPGSDKVWQKVREMGVVMMTADWTRQDSRISYYLQSFGRAGVPLNVIYSPNADSKPIVMPAVLGPDTVLQGLSQVEL